MAICPLCHNIFECNPEADCWCRPLPLEASMPKNIGWCRCPECLQQKPVAGKTNLGLAPRQGQRPATPFQRDGAGTASFLKTLKKK